MGEAISELDRATQQNTALVGQISLASNRLQEQGRELQEVAAFFDLNAVGTVPRQAAQYPKAAPSPPGGRRFLVLVGTEA